MITYGFYDSLDGDRKYSALQLSSMFDGLIVDGVFATIGTSLVVREYQNMSLYVGEGKAWFNHSWLLNSTDHVVTIDTAEPVLNRIDAVVIEFNSEPETRANSIKVIKGTPASTPENPELTHTTSVNQYPLAYVLVEAGVTSIPSAKITNAVGGDDCPFVSALLTGIEAGHLIAQWTSELNIMMDTYQADFEAWFQNLQDQLDDNQAANLQNQITALQNGSDLRDTGWIPLAGTWSQTGLTAMNEAYVDSTGNFTTVVETGMRIRYEQNVAPLEYWPLNQDSVGLKAGTTGTDTAITYTPSAGPFSDGVASFNGTSSKIVFSNNISILKPTEFTFGCWAQKPSGSANRFIFHSGSKNTNVAGFSIEILASNVVRVTIGNNTGTVEGTNYTVLDSTSTITTTYKYIVVTYKDAVASLYIDGVLEARKSTVSLAYATTTYHRIGCFCAAGTDSLFWNGSIDDLFLLEKALDPKTIYNKYKALTAQGVSDVPVKKYGIVNDVSYVSGSNKTYITFWGGTDYSIVESRAMNNVHISMSKSPFGFDSGEDKWTIVVLDTSDRTVTTPTYNAWVNIPVPTLQYPRGVWEVSYEATFTMSKSTATSVKAYFTLSTANNTEHDKEFTCALALTGTSSTLTPVTTMKRSKLLRSTGSTTLYMNGFNTISTGLTNFAVLGSVGTTVLKARYALL